MNEFWSTSPEFVFSDSSRITTEGVEYAISGRIFLRRDQLSLLLQAAERLGKDVSFRETVINRGGAPAKYDGEAFLIEAFRIIYEERNQPKSPAELMKRSLDAYAEAGLPGGTPSLDWARGRIKSLWKKLGLN